jgi:hypothetical protein
MSPATIQTSRVHLAEVSVLKRAKRWGLLVNRVLPGRHR